MPSTMSMLWSMLMTSGLHAAIRSISPPLPLMYKMMGTCGWVERNESMICKVEKACEASVYKNTTRCKSWLSCSWEVFTQNSKP